MPPRSSKAYFDDEDLYDDYDDHDDDYNEFEEHHVSGTNAGVRLSRCKVCGMTGRISAEMLWLLNRRTQGKHNRMRHSMLPHAQVSKRQISASRSRQKPRRSQCQQTRHPSQHPGR